MSMSLPALSPHGMGSFEGEPLARVLVIDDSLTILKVVGAILERNGYAVSLARDGREGLQMLRSQGNFDLILLDFVMPRMNGYQFCRELRADEEHKHMPVVLMSARTNAIGERFVEQTGAVDALAKPFDARALVAVVGNVLAKREDSVAKSLPSPDTMVDEDDFDQPESAAPPSQYVRSVSGIASLIAEALAPELPSVRLPQLKEAADRVFQNDTLRRLAAAIDELEVRDPDEVLRGSTVKMPLAEILQMLQLRRQNGVMRVSHKGKEVSLYIKDGLLLLAQSTGTKDEFRLGRYFVEKGWVSRDDIDALAAAKPAGQLFGEWLLSEGKVDEAQLQNALGKQSAELVYEVLRWPDASFTLHEKPLPDEANKARLELGLSELALEGFRRVDEWRLMADTIDFNAVLVVDQVALGTVDESKIASNERPVLMAIDGKRTVREVMEQVELASFDAIKAIYRFLQSRIVRELKPKSVPPDKGSEAGASAAELSQSGPSHPAASASTPGGDPKPEGESAIG